MVAQNVLITGCSRGLGLEMVKYLVALPTPPLNIFATCRNPPNAKELNEIAKASTATEVHVEKLDVTAKSDVDLIGEKVSERGGKHGLNLLVNNAGIFTDSQNVLANKKQKLGDQSEESFLEHFRVNTIAPLMLTKALLPSLLLASRAVKEEGAGLSGARAAVVSMSAQMGSIGENKTGGAYPLRLSKCALNMASKNLSLELGPQGILVLLLHPGWVQTDMGGPKGMLTPEACIKRLFEVIQKAGQKEAGTLITYQGKTVA